MQDLQVFRFQSAQVRTAQKDGEVWFVATDVCKVLGLEQVSRAISRLDEDEKGVTSITTLGGAQQLSIINESGLYSLILTSRKPEAKAFKKWITSEVLPAIRKTGSYSLQPTQPASPLALAETMLHALKQQDTRLQALEDWKDTAPINSAQIAVIHRLGQRLGHLIGFAAAWKS